VEDAESNALELKLGLCANCVHARSITSDKGSTFLQCSLSFSDPRFAKYPRLPVRVCSGWRERAT
jgi:hypothetical protein